MQWLLRSWQVPFYNFILIFIFNNNIYVCTRIEFDSSNTVYVGQLEFKKQNRHWTCITDTTFTAYASNNRGVNHSTITRSTLGLQIYLQHTGISDPPLETNIISLIETAAFNKKCCVQCLVMGTTVIGLPILGVMLGLSWLSASSTMTIDGFYNGCGEGSHGFVPSTDPPNWYWGTVPHWFGIGRGL